MFFGGFGSHRNSMSYISSKGALMYCPKVLEAPACQHISLAGRVHTTILQETQEVLHVILHQKGTPLHCDYPG